MNIIQERINQLNEQLKSNNLSIKTRCWLWGKRLEWKDLLTKYSNK